MGTAAAKHEEQEKLRRNEQKWTRTVLDAGWTLLPSIILERQQDLELDATDINILLHLIRHWWYSDNPPRPSKATVAGCMGVDPSTVRRHIRKMERRGLIAREYRFDPIKGQMANTYVLTGLVEKARPLAEEFVAERERRHQQDAERRTRRTPRLKVVEPRD